MVLSIYEIKRRVQAHDSQNPYFFNRNTMKFFKQTLKDFRVRKLKDGKFFIYATDKQGHKDFLRGFNVTARVFDPQTNTLAFPKLADETLVQDEWTKKHYLIEHGE